MTSYRPLHDGWTVSVDGHADVPAPVSAAPVPATVPGCVHTDLLAAGLIPDPFLDDNENALTWIGRADWRYETTFDWQHADDDRIDLCCQGLDTVASITLNGEPVARTENSTARTGSTSRVLLRAGTNTLSVDVRLRRIDMPRPDAPNSATAPPPTRAVQLHPQDGLQLRLGLGTRPWSPPASGGRSACRAGRPPRIAAVRPLVSRRMADRRRGGVTSSSTGPRRCRVDRHGRRGASASARLTVAAGQRVAVVRCAVPDVGAVVAARTRRPAATPCGVRLTRMDGTAARRWQRRIGFRTVAAGHHARRATGTPFTLVVNGQPVFVRGVNWIPDDVFPHRVDPRPATPPARPGGRRRRQPACASGAAALRERGLLRHCRRAGPAGLAGLPVRLRRLPRGGAARARWTPRPGKRRPADAAPEPGAVERQQREHLGLRRLGLAGAAGRAAPGALGYYLDLLPRHRRRARPDPAVLAGQPLLGHAGPAPERPGARHHAHLGRVEPAATTPPTASYRPRFVAEFGFQAPPAWSTLRRGARPTSR